MANLAAAMSMLPTTRSISISCREIIAVLLAVLILKLIVLAIDPTMRLFLGDSATYLRAAVTGSTPLDRSFTYPLLIAATAAPLQWLTPLLWLQTAMGVLASLMVFDILRRVFSVRRWIAASTALLLAVEPAQLFYERMVLTETSAWVCLLGCLYCALRYFERGHLRWLLLLAIVGAIGASFRISVALAAWLMATLPPLIRWLSADAKESRGLLLAATHLLVALVATQVCQQAYKSWYGARAGMSADYTANAGIYRLGLVAPLLEPEHFEGTGISPKLLDEVIVPLRDVSLREAQVWNPVGLAGTLARRGGKRTNEIAKILADRAMRDDPWGWVKLGLDTVAGYFDPLDREVRMRDDLGLRRRPDAETQYLMEDFFHYDALTISSTSSPVFVYFGASAGWLILCLFALLPIALTMLMFQRARSSGPAWLLFGGSLGMTLGYVLFAHIMSFRYLHPFPGLLLINLAVLANCWPARRGTPNTLK